LVAEIEADGGMRSHWPGMCARKLTQRP
jgi:hypothetical protein